MLALTQKNHTPQSVFGQKSEGERTGDLWNFVFHLNVGMIYFSLFHYTRFGRFIGESNPEIQRQKWLKFVMLRRQGLLYSAIWIWLELIGYASQKALSCFDFWLLKLWGFIALEISAYLGHVGLVKLLAAQHGPLMHTQRSTLLANALRNAAQNGHLPVLRQLEALGIIRIGNETEFDKDKAEK